MEIITIEDLVWYRKNTIELCVEKCMLVVGGRENNTSIK